MSEVTPTICYDGEYYQWSTICREGTSMLVSKTGWCCKCGSLTEFQKDVVFQSQFKRVIEEDNTYYIEIPKQAQQQEGS